MDASVPSAQSTTTTESTSSSSSVQPTYTIQEARVDFCETPDSLTITFYAKNLQPINVRIDGDDGEGRFRHIAFLARDDQRHVDYSNRVRLLYPVKAPYEKLKVTPSKVEVRLLKTESRQWNRLERDDAQDVKTTIAPTTADVAPPPPPNKTKYDWDKLARDVTDEEEKEEPEGEAAAMKLFKKIYADGSEETRKAMMKSYAESGGTCLSTNWSDVGKERVKIQPPDGMEWREWEQ